MSSLLKATLPFLVVLSLLAPIAIYLATRSIRPPASPTLQTQDSPALSVLGEAPDWRKLEAYQESITREDFEMLLTTVFTTGDAWAEFIEINESNAIIRTGDSNDSKAFILRFAPPGAAMPSPRDWKRTSDLPAAAPETPLAGLHIAIDPGHIGGKWATIEERRLIVGNSPPICEGDMTLQVANLLKPRLEALGAKVSLVREKAEPVTPLRPETLLETARESGSTDDSPAALQKLSERLFYRTAEIRARAKLVNESLKPDLVLCLHFNAEAWGDPDLPTLVDRTHFHLLLNGAYTDDEVRLADQRFALLEKLLSRSHEEEALVGATIADIFAADTGLPPFQYPADSTNAVPVRDHPYLWARNLLANRLYRCPVIFLEPYVMNSTTDCPRMQAGDFDGRRQINGSSQASIFQEYADALTRGLRRHYSKNRPALPLPDL